MPPLARVDEVVWATGGTDDYAAVELAINAASDMIEQYANRSFSPALATRSFEVVNASAEVDDIATAEGLVVSVDGVLASGYSLAPRNAFSQGRPATRLENLGQGKLATVTASFGWPSVPAAVHQAAVIQALRLFQRRHSPFGVAGSPEMGSELRLLSKLDPDVEVLVRPYSRRWWVA